MAIVSKGQGTIWLESGRTFYGFYLMLFFPGGTWCLLINWRAFPCTPNGLIAGNCQASMLQRHFANSSDIHFLSSAYCLENIIQFEYLFWFCLLTSCQAFSWKEWLSLFQSCFQADHKKYICKLLYLAKSAGLSFKCKWNSLYHPQAQHQNVIICWSLCIC